MVQRLSTAEAVTIDLDRVAQLPMAPGTDATGWQHLDGLVAALCEAEVAWADGRLRTLGDLARVIETTADLVGMTTFARVSRDVADLSHGRDITALSSCVARLVRVGEASLAAIWDMPNLRL